MNLETMQRFAAKELSRCGIDHPFIQKGRTYATNGQWCIRHAKPLDGALAEGWFPPCDSVIPSRDKLSETPLILPDGEAPVQPMMECGACHGGCECHCECGNKHACEQCGGTGKMPDGPPPAHDFGEVAVQWKHIAVLRELGSTLYPHIETPERRPVYFVVDDETDGAVMPCLMPKPAPAR